MPPKAFEMPDTRNVLRNSLLLEDVTTNCAFQVAVEHADGRTGFFELGALLQQTYLLHVDDALPIAFASIDEVVKEGWRTAPVRPLGVTP